MSIDHSGSQGLLAYHESLFAVPGVAIGFLGPDLRYWRVNDALARLTGEPVDAHPGRTIIDLMGAAGEPLAQAARHVRATGEPLLGVRVDAPHTSTAMAAGPWMANVFPVRDGGAIVGVGCMLWAMTDAPAGATNANTDDEFERSDPAVVMPPGAHGAARGRTPTRGSETVLLVDDDADVRRMCQRSLTAYGYHVLDAASSAEALVRAAEHGGPIHLLLTDVILPDRNGLELAARLRESQPDAGILYMTGYPDHDEFRRGVQEGRLDYLHKPFLPSTLAAKVREVLDRAGAVRTTEAA